MRFHSAISSLRNSVVTLVCFNGRGIDDRFSSFFAPTILTGFLLGISSPVRVAANGPNFQTKRDASQKALPSRSEEHTSELQSHSDLVCRLLLEKKNKIN